MIRIIDECVGPTIERAIADGNRVNVTLRREPMTRSDWTTHDYNVHFSVGITNDADVATEALVSVAGGEWGKLPSRAPLLYSATSLDGPWGPAGLEARTDLKKKYAVRIPLAPGQCIFIANTLPRKLNRIQSAFDDLALRGGARRFVYGQSLEGRDLISYHYGEPNKRAAILVTSGFHSPEPDTFASKAIMTWLAGPEAAAMLSQLGVVVVPITNPDGYAHQTQGSNAAGVNLFWDFRVEDERNCPEASALWRLAADLAPRGYIDFHAYTFQLEKVAGPYCRPLQCYRNPIVREAARTLYAKLSAGPDSAPVTGFSTYAPATLGSRLNRQFDTLTVAKYHLHLKEGVDDCEHRGLAVFRALGERLIASRLTTRDAATAPAPGLLDRSRVLWAGLVRPTLGLIRRGRFAEINLQRSGLITPQE